MKLSSQTDLEVFQALKAGDQRAFGVFYDRYGEIIYRLALRMLNNPQEAEDLTQEVFVYLFQKANYDPSRGSLITFLMTLTRSRAIDHLRRLQSRRQSLQRWQTHFSSGSSQEHPMDQASLSEMSEKIRGALAEIPENQRQALEMAYYEGLSQSEITEKLAIPLGTVKTRSRQGLLKLRKLLQDVVE